MTLVTATLETTFEIADEELQRQTASGACALVDGLIANWLASNPRANTSWLIEESSEADNTVAA